MNCGLLHLTRFRARSGEFETCPLPRRAAERVYAPGRSIDRLPNLRVACLLVEPPVHGSGPFIIDLLTRHEPATAWTYGASFQPLGIPAGCRPLAGGDARHERTPPEKVPRNPHRPQPGSQPQGLTEGLGWHPSGMRWSGGTRLRWCRRSAPSPPANGRQASGLRAIGPRQVHGKYR